MEEERVNSRFFGLDIIRVIAAFCVVINHTVESIYSLNYDGISILPTNEKYFVLYVLLWEELEFHCSCF